jgi:hypothetical protein
MSGVEAAASVAGLTSLGIQVCQGLLAYYDAYRDYHIDIRSTYDSITYIAEVFVSLNDVLEDPKLPAKLKAQVLVGITACEASLLKTQAKLQKLRTHDVPVGARQKAWAELQRMCYPLRASILAKLRELMDQLREDLSLAINVLQLDVGIDAIRKLDGLAIQSQAIANELSLVKDQGLTVDAKLNDISKLSSGVSNQVSDVTTHAVEIKQSVDDLRQDVESVAETISRDERESMIKWLSPADMTPNHEAAQRRRESGTGQWLLTGSPYAPWKTSGRPLCWLKGQAGCGKTILCSTVIDDLETFVTTAVEGQAQLVYFYFSFADTQKQSLQSFLRSAVAQLCHIKPVFDRLKLMKGSSSTGAPSSQDLRKIFELALEHTRLFVVIDALDEVPEHQDQRQDVLDWITRTVAAFGDKMKIFATSRAEQDIKAMMLDAVQIDIHRAIVDADIATYVSNELERDGRLRKLSDDLKLHIKQELSSKADGM